MKTHIVSTVAIGLFLLSGYSHADLKQIQAYIDQGDSQQAYRLAAQLLDENEGDPAFDFLYGVAAVDSGRVSEGVFALERVLLLQPGHNLARLELARAYYYLGHHAKARELFVQVLSVNPPALVKTRIQGFLDLISQKTVVEKTRFKSFVELWGGYDSNINSGPDSEPTVVILTNEALGRSDVFSQVKLGAVLEHDYSTRATLLLNADADLRFYDTEVEQDYRNLSLSAAHRWNYERDQIQVGLTGQKYYLDDDEYRDLYGINVGWSHQLSKRSVLRTSLSINELTYDQSDYRDSTQSTLGANLLYAGQGWGTPIWFAGVFVGDETPDEDGLLANAEADRSFYGASLGVQLSPQANLTLTPSIIYQSSDYRGEDWIYSVKREEDYSAFNLAVEWGLNKEWTLLANYNYAEAESNIELYEYERQQVMLGIRYNF